MHWTMALLYAVMVLWVAPVALRDGTALALLAAWAAGEIIVRLTGEAVPVEAYILFDAIVISYVVGHRQLLPMVIIALYPVQWYAYAYVTPLRAQWFMLWGITLVQFLLAGWQGRLQGRGNDLGTVVQERRPFSGGHHSSIPADLAVAPPYAGGSFLGKLGETPVADWKSR